MPSTFHVATTGNDSNVGSLASPFLTPSHALNVSAIGDLIYIHHGVYTDLWPTAKIVGRDIRAYNGEDVTIDLGGVNQCLNGVTDTQLSSTISGTPAFYLRLIGIKFVNYTGKLIQDASVFVGVCEFTIAKCFFKPSGASGRALGTSANSNVTIRLENCTFESNFRALFDFPPYGNIIRNCIFNNNTINIDSGDTGFETINDSGSQLNYLEKDHNAYPGNTIEPHPINTSSVAIGYNNAGAGDYSLSPTSALRGSGKDGANIGAPFNPMLYVDGEFSDFVLSAMVNDTLWYDPGVPGPGTEGPANAGPFIISAGVGKIDNVTVPGATSARGKSGPHTLPSGAHLTVPGWFGVEDTTPSSGSRQVIDFTAGTSTRDIQVSINGGAKQTYTKTTFIDQPATTVTFFITLRSNGV